MFRAPRVLCRAGLLYVPVGGGPPASRPRREPSARRVVSKPGQAPPPPTGTAARPSGPSGALHTSGAWRADVWLGASPPSPARPCALMPIDQWSSDGIMLLNVGAFQRAHSQHRYHGLFIPSQRHFATRQGLPPSRRPHLSLLMRALHPIRRHYTPSVRVYRDVTGVSRRNGCSAT